MGVGLRKAFREQFFDFDVEIVLGVDDGVHMA